jgi:hypothetical protein
MCVKIRLCKPLPVQPDKRNLSNTRERHGYNKSNSKPESIEGQAYFYLQKKTVQLLLIYRFRKSKFKVSMWSIATLIVPRIWKRVESRSLRLLIQGQKKKDQVENRRRESYQASSGVRRALI